MEDAVVAHESASAGTLLCYAREPNPTSFMYFTERYFHQFLIEQAKSTPGNNCRILQHSNGLFILCIDPSHAAIAAVKGGEVTVTSVTFGSGRSNSSVTPDSIKVVGKRKRNALICQADTKICSITLSNGTVYTIPACINGFVLELNGALMDNPWLVVEAPTAEGFLAVINPSTKNDLSHLQRLWTATGGEAGGEDDD